MKISIAFDYFYQEIKLIWIPENWYAMLRLNRRHVYWDNVAPSSGMKAIDVHVLEGATPYQCEENGA